MGLVVFLAAINSILIVAIFSTSLPLAPRVFYYEVRSLLMLPLVLLVSTATTTTTTTTTTMLSIVNDIVVSPLHSVFSCQHLLILVPRTAATLTAET